jgi:hypothetical protein
VLGNFFSNTLNGPANGPKNLWLKPFGNQKFFMFNHTSSPSSKLTFHYDLFTKSLYRLCTFSKLAFTIFHKCRLSSSSCVTIGTSSLASLGVVHVLPKSSAQLVSCPSSFEKG